MYRIVVLVLCYQALSQPVTNEPSSRLARELIECCPCPGASDVQDWLAGADDDNLGQLARAGGVADDCPCRTRGADSEGAPSLFFPAALHPDVPHLRQTDPKEDPKNLLEPEVALATSMLDTLREVTEEEYRNALEREAAKNAAEPDAVPEESARNVVIVVNPKDSENDDNFVSEESHVKESRCIHPLGRTSSSENRINTLPETIKLPNLKHPKLSHRNLLHYDNNIGPSNIGESIDNTSGNELKFTSKTSEVQQKPLKSLLQGTNKGIRFSTPNFRLGNFNDKELIEGIEIPLAPKLNQHKDTVDDDLSFAPSDIKNHFEPATDKTTQIFINDKLPLNLRNLLKLRDVELIPKTLRIKSWAKPKLDISKFAIPNLFKSNQDKKCKEEVNYSDNIAFKSVNTDLAQKEMENANDDILTDTNTIENTNEFQDTKAGSINKLFNKMKATPNDNISNDDESDAIEDQSIYIDTFLSPSQVQPSFIRTDSETASETVISPKSAVGCNYLELNDSVKNSGFSENTDKSQEIDSESAHLEKANSEIENFSNTNDDESSDSLRNQNTNIDSNIDSSNTILFTLLPTENQEKDKSIESQENSEVDSEFIDKNEVNNQIVPASFIHKHEDIPHVKENMQLSETLSTLRENIVNQLGNLKKPSKLGFFKTPNDNENFKTIDEEEVSINDDTNQKRTNLDVANTFDVDTKENMTDISMNDLQNMSDQLLDSTNNHSSMNLLQPPKSIITHKTYFKSFEINDNTDSELSETNLNSLLMEEETDATDELDESFSPKNFKEIACPTNLETKNSVMTEENAPKSATQDEKQKEMEIGASDTVISSLPSTLDSLNPNLKLRSPLINDFALQPSSNALNLLGSPLGDVLSLNTNLPTLDDFKERLVSIFDTNDGSIENELSSLGATFKNDSPLETMSAKESTINYQRELPLLKQLEALNSDTIQNQANIFVPTNKKPRLHDLNSYRAHLPSPNSLDLKALKSEIKLRDQVEIKKPLINFGFDRTVPRKAKQSNTLANPLYSFPTLDELRDTLRLSTRNLLNNPIHTDLNSLSKNLRASDIDDVTQNIRLNTEKTLKGIQRKMKSSLRKPNLQNPLAESLAKPQELLEDMNDKLKGLHYDLNDRLSSIRESFLDSSRLKTIVDQPRKANNRNVMTSFRKSKTKQASPCLQTAASKTTNQESDLDSLGLEPRSHIRPDWNWSRKTQIAAAESAPPLARVEMPKPVSPLLSNRVSPSFRQNPIVLESLRERTPISSLNREVKNSKDTKEPLFRTALTPLSNQHQQNKVTISFDTTTPRPTTPSRPIIRAPNMSPLRLKKYDPNSDSSDAIDRIPKENTLFNLGIQPGKFKPLRTSAPLPSPTDEDFEDTLNNFSNEGLSATDTKFKSSVLREMSTPKSHKIHNNSNRLKSTIFDDNIENHASKSVVKITHLPKVPENSFLSKVRDAAIKRKLSTVSKPVNDEKTEQLDMLRSPTENTGKVMDEPLKENVSYRCRMVCTKEIR